MARQNRSTRGRPIGLGPGADHRDIGQLQTYVAIVDDLFRKPQHDDQPTIGILLATDRDEMVISYALPDVPGTPT